MANYFFDSANTHFRFLYAKPRLFDSILASGKAATRPFPSLPIARLRRLGMKLLIVAGKTLAVFRDVCVAVLVACENRRRKK